MIPLVVVLSLVTPGARAVTARAWCVLAFAAGVARGHPPAPEGDVAPLIHAASTSLVRARRW
jgi:hypothetical protein